jgi:hypothetical protein
VKSYVKLSVLVLALSVLGLLFRGQAHAATFTSNNIMDDGVFNNTNSMNVAQINSFLNQFSSSCISTNNGFSAPDPTGYSPTTGFTYGGNVTAGQVIYDAAVAYGLNPQVLITTLQKEQSLVTGSSGCSTIAYVGAVGYGCPDGGTTYSYTGVNLYTINGATVSSVTGTCVNSSLKAGFSQQLIHAAWLLKFGEQRSEGNISWAIIQGNWINTDDPQSCYGGPMTQGTWQICPGGAAIYYDGYTTIDGTAVHMDNGATAALYWYTPHFAGNQNFFNIFNAWFGSTYFPQPIGGSLLYQSSTGMIFLTTGTTRYYIPSWAMMTNYGLDTYPIQPVTDAIIQQYTDGGTLTNLVSNSGNVYLVNNRELYYVSPAMCTAWNLSCFDDTVVQSLGSTFQTQYLSQGFDLTNLAESNGVIYEMSNGLKQPIANPKTLSDLGLNTTPVLVTSTINSNQPLGPLLITTPGVIQLYSGSPLYYFDGLNYYQIPDMISYNDWGLANSTKLTAPASSYTTTPPTSTVLSSYVNLNGTDYIIDQGRKLIVPANIGTVWPTSQFVSAPLALLNALPTTTLTQNVYNGSSFFVLSIGEKHYVTSTDDFPGLSINPTNITNLNNNKLQSVTSGVDALPDGKLIITNSDGKIYVVNNHKLTYIPSPSIFNAYGYSWNKIFSYPTESVLTSEYPIDTNVLGTMIDPSGNVFMVSGSTSYEINSSLVQDFGIITSGLSPITDQAIKKTNIPALPRFLYNSDNGEIYYASGGAIHYVSSITSYKAYGGLNTTPVTVNNQFISQFVLGQSI